MSSGWKGVLHWLNSLPIDSCLLVDTIDDLTDGQVLCEIVSHVEGRQVPTIAASSSSDITPITKIQSALCYLVSGSHLSYVCVYTLGYYYLARSNKSYS